MSETYELTTKPKQDLEFILEKKKDEFLSLCAANVKADTAYLLRAKTELLTGPCLSILGTKAGMQSAIKAIFDTGMIGLSFGGPRPMAYFVPKEGKVTPIYEASGYKYACTYGPGAILAEYPTTIVVKEGDSVKVNPDKRTIEYKDGGYNPFDPNRGKVVGFLMRLVYKDGRRPEIRECDMQKVKKIQTGYSMTGSPMYKKSDEEADLKTAEKSMLRLAFKEACQRAQVALEEGDEFDDEQEPAPPPRDAGERLSRTISAAVERMDPGASVDPVDDEPEPEAPDQEEPEQATRAEPKQEDGDLFK